MAGAAACAALVALAAPPATAQVATAPADSSRLLVEVGAGGDVSNQIFYETSFDSAAFRERVTVSDPETRIGALGLVSWMQTHGRTTILLSNELRAGDALFRNLARAGIAWVTDPRGQVSLDLEADARKDTSFGFQRRDLRLSALLSARRTTADRAGSARLFGRAERIRGDEDDTAGGVELFPDFDFVQAGIDGDRMWGLRGTATLSYALGYRTFPDTTERDHVQHALGASGLYRIDDDWSADLFLDAVRRAARVDSAIGDRVWQADLEVRLVRQAGERWELGLRTRARGQRYDAPTPTFFDATAWRYAAFGRYRASSGIEIELRPEIEYARTPDFGGVPEGTPGADLRAIAGEEYDELALRGEIERFAVGGWWTVSPAFGQRNYLLPADHAEDLSSHSDFWFAEVAAYADRRLAPRLTVRASADLRFEFHEIDSDDAKSLSVAAELRVPLM